MTIRPGLRALVALVALLTFSASLAEQAWGIAACDTALESMSVADHAGSGHGSHGHHAADADPVPEGPAPDNGPFSCPAMAAMGCAAASLPSAPAEEIRAAAVEIPILTLAPDAAHDLLLAVSLFHPPQG